MTTPLKSIFDFLNKFKEHKNIFLSFFNLSFKEMIDSTLWERDTEIIMDGTKYIMDKEYWENVIGNPTNERVLLKAFYTHADDSLLENEDKSKVLLEILKKYKCSEILELIGHEFAPYPITKADPSQFSDFKDAYYSVPFLLANCGKTDVDYNQMGYMLRSEKRKEVADKKYGENHMKTAAQLGLCRFAKCRANANALGSNFVKLNERDMKAILPKLCLYIPYIQNYFMAGATDEVREEILSILSKTTQTRRRPNVNMIIETVKESIEYEL